MWASFARCRFAGVSYFCQSRTHTWMTLTLTLPETLPGWTWVRVSSLVSIGPAVWPAIQNIDHDKQTDKHITFYYIDIVRYIVRWVLYVDRLPYVEATILELLRYKTVAPLAMTHCTLKDTEVGGYFVPRGTSVSWHALKYLYGKNCEQVMGVIHMMQYNKADFLKASTVDIVQR